MRKFNFTHCEYCSLSFAIREESLLAGLCAECWEELFADDPSEILEQLEAVDECNEWICVECQAAFGGHSCMWCSEPLCYYCHEEHEIGCDDYDSDLFDEDDDL